ncbi:MAG: SUF system Fe-S cluster assembly regulator [Planctomycetota bacterium]
MIRLTKKTDYGIVLMTHFARDPGRAVHNAREIAAETRLPLPIVSQVLKVLARGGLLASHRGTKGGYTLTRPPEEVAVSDVLRAIEGPIGLMECTLGFPGMCRHEPLCAVRSHWQWINRAFLEAMDNLTLAHLAMPPALFARRMRLRAAAGATAKAPATGAS